MLVTKTETLRAGVTASDAALTLKIAPAMAKEHLLTAETKGTKSNSNQSLLVETHVSIRFIRCSHSHLFEQVCCVETWAQTGFDSISTCFPRSIRRISICKSNNTHDVFSVVLLFEKLINLCTCVHIIWQSQGLWNVRWMGQSDQYVVRMTSFCCRLFVITHTKNIQTHLVDFLWAKERCV